MNENEKASVPYYVHEGVVTHMERNNRRLLIALIVSVCVLLLNNISWLVYEGVQHPARNPVTIEETMNEGD